MKKKKIRNPAAIPAKSRKSSGPMRNKKDKRKSNKKKDILSDEEFTARINLAIANTKPFTEEQYKILFDLEEDEQLFSGGIDYEPMDE